MSSILFFSIAYAAAIVGFLLLCAKKKESKQNKSKENRSEPPSQSVKESVSSKQLVSEVQNKSFVEVKTAVEEKSDRLPANESSDQLQDNKSAIEEISVNQKLCAPQIANQESAYVLTAGESIPKKESAAGVKKGQQKAMEIQPKKLHFTSKGGGSKLNLENNTGNRVAIKMKCSDNSLFRLNPIYLFIERDGKATVDISRLDGAPKLDKLDVVYAETASDENDAQAVFKDAPATGKLSVPIFVN